MTAQYRLRILSSAGALLDEIAPNPGGNDLTRSGFSNLAYTNLVNSFGTLSFTLPGTHVAIADLTERCQVEVWRRDIANGLDWYRDWSGLFLDEERWYDNKTGQHLYKATCYSDAFMLQDRIIGWTADTANRSSFTGVHAETIMKTLVTYNCTSSASVANGRLDDGTMAGVSVQADAAGGNILDLKCTGDDLLKTLQKIALVGGGDFDLIKTGAQAWEFRWYTGQRGTDRHASLVFSTALGNMGVPKYIRKRSVKKTSILVGGQGIGSNRTMIPLTGNGYSAPLNFEAFYNGSGQNSTTASLTAVGNAQLVLLREAVDFSFTVLPTPSCVYSRDWFLGDRATSKYLTYITTPKIVSVAITVADNTGQETITPGLSYV